MKDYKKDILAMKTSEELSSFETDLLISLRNEFYNKLLENEEVKSHIAKLLDVPADQIENALMINGFPPLDDFDED